MLEYMKLMIGGYIGWETIEISVINEKYIVKHQKALWADWSVFEDVDLIDWNTKLENVHINKWRKEYVNTGILDGTQWNLEYKVKDKRCRHIYGSNAYPENFDDFMQVLGELYKIIDVQAFWEGDEVE